MDQRATLLGSDRADGAPAGAHAGPAPSTAPESQGSDECDSSAGEGCSTAAGSLLGQPTVSTAPAQQSMVTVAAGPLFRGMPVLAHGSWATSDPEHSADLEVLAQSLAVASGRKSVGTLLDHAKDADLHNCTLSTVKFAVELSWFVLNGCGVCIGCEKKKWKKRLAEKRWAITETDFWYEDESGSRIIALDKIESIIYVNSSKPDKVCWVIPTCHCCTDVPVDLIVISYGGQRVCIGAAKLSNGEGALESILHHRAEAMILKAAP